jgi:hypothetical protein
MAMSGKSKSPPGETPDSGEDDMPSLPDDCPLNKLYRKRVAQNRDLTVLISDWNLERGSGKTTLGLRLMSHFDRTDEGITPSKATLSAKELINAYTEQPANSALLLDEGQADASNRRSMSGINEALRKIVGLARVERKFCIMTSPGVNQVDRDIRNMCDIWIFVRSLGEAQMFRVQYNPFQDTELTHDWGTLKWGPELPGQLQHTYDELTAEKRKRLRGEGDDGEGYVQASKVQEQVEEQVKDTKRQTRDGLINDIYTNSDDMTQQELADAVGLSRSRIADILSE